MENNQNYKQIDRLNQSSLKKLLQGPVEFQNELLRREMPEEESEKEHFIFGRLLDTLLLGTTDDVDNNFHIIPDAQTCSEAIKQIIEQIFAEIPKDIPIKTLDSGDYNSLILTIGRRNGYQANYKDDTLIQAIIKAGSHYFELLKLALNKSIVTQSEYSKAVICKAALLSDIYIKKYVDKKEAKRNNIEFWDHFTVLYSLLGVELKGELDRVVIDHNNKTITYIDFKSTGKSILGFIYDFWRLRYDFQSGSYYLGASSHPSITALLEKGYKVVDFLYIVVEKECFHKPMIFSVPEKVLEIGLNGGELSNGRKLEGLIQAIERYKFHKKADNWEYPKEYIEQQKIIIEV